MSIKNLFTDFRNSSKNYNEYTTDKEFFKEIESVTNASALQLSADTFVPHLDYSRPENFIQFGSAELFYDAALTRIVDYYPYDGSEAEKTDFYNKLYEGEKYIFDNLYPRFTGYVNLCSTGWGSLDGSKTADDYGKPATLEHITFKGGPHSSNNSGQLKTLTNNPHNNKYQSANIYEDNVYTAAGLPTDYGQGTRQSNLKANFETGVAVEFWLKKAGFDAAKTGKEVVFDLWNSSSAGASDYGRLTIELSSSGSPFLITAQSGATSGSILHSTIGSTPSVSSLTNWHHYALRFYNSGSSFISKLYVDGKLDDTNIYTPYAATATITTTGAPGHMETFCLTDATGLEVCYVFDRDVTTVNGDKFLGRVIIGVDGAIGSAAAVGDRMRAAIAASDIGMSVVETGAGVMRLTQNTGGPSGNTTIDMSGVATTTATNFTGGLNRDLGEITTANMIGRVGSLLSTPISSSATAGAGKLSASLDDFRFWKSDRNSREIATNYFVPVNGGTNTDISNTTLGIYYKFNEGISQNTTFDSTVLDYSGRISNGVWTGYSATSRNTGSAIVSSSVALTEYKDPVVYNTHPDYLTLSTNLKTTGQAFDNNNNNAFINYMPAWVLDQHDDTENKNLRIISNIVGTYFDKMSYLSSELPKLKHTTYTSASYSPASFASHMPTSLGLYTPELFVDSTILERLKNKTDNSLLEGNLQDTKNLIYLNLYNNLTNIFKAKGTEKSIRNVMRCFYLDDQLIKFKKYNVNATYDISNNYEQQIVKKRGLNFNTGSNLGAVVYQRKNTANPQSSGYISGTINRGTIAIGDEQALGFTLESDIIFPNFFPRYDTFRRNYKTVSLFGVHSVSGSRGTASLDGTDTTFLSNDVANFQVLAIRDREFSKNVFFKLTSSYSPHPLPVLTSSDFPNVYDGSKWNISVRVEPDWDDTRYLDARSTGNYKVIFRGVNDVLGTSKNSFELSASISNASGSNLLRSSKRVYVGAQRTNLTGTLINKSDVVFLNCRAWLKSLDNASLNAHNYGRENSGITDTQEYLSPYEVTDITNKNTLALDWTFNNVTSSDGSGNFVVADASSGSILLRNNYGRIGKMAGHQHSGYGANFASSTTKVVKDERINSFVSVDPEQVISSDMINILSADDEVLGIEQTVPDYLFTIEKSMYEAVSSEILTFFAGAIDFNNLIGNPVNRYRERYKDMEKLRQAFFRRVTKTSNVEKFIEYYKWFDDGLTTVLNQLLPASAQGLDKMLNVVESHVLERNKYKTPFPTLESRQPDPEGVIGGRVEADYPYAVGFSPPPQSPRDTKIRSEYWKRRAERTSIELSSSNPIVDSHREIYRKIINSNPYLNKPLPVLYTGNETYTIDTYARRNFIKTQVFDVKKAKTYKAGSNFEPNKNIGFALTSVRPAGPVNTREGSYIPLNVLLSFMEDLVQVSTNNDPKPELNVKKKRHFKVRSGQNYEDGVGYYNLKSSVAYPFSIYETDVTSGYQNQLVTRLSGTNVEITNLHNDVYGPDNEKPMQGPFTEYAVGGHQSRHIRLNKGSDSPTNRPEAWRILVGTCAPNLSGAIGLVGPDYPDPATPLKGAAAYPYRPHQKAVYYRDMVAKRPVNIKNIRMTTGSTVLGNYSNTYEYIQTVGAFQNPRKFVDNQPSLPSQAFENNTTSSTSIRTFLDTHRLERGHFENLPEYSTDYLNGANNKSIIVSRFSAPGSIETMTRGYQDFKSTEFSVYNALNYRNLSVRKPSQGPASTISEKTPVSDFGVKGDTTDILVSDIHGMDYGLTSHLARHTARFGRDSLIFPPNSQRVVYDLNKSFIGYSNKNIYRSSHSLQGWWRFDQDLTGVDAIDSSGRGRDATFLGAGNRPAFTTELFPSRYIQTGSVTFDGADDQARIGSAATWDAIIGNDTSGGSTQKMTFAAWIYATSYGEDNFGRILSFGDDDIAFYVHNSGRLGLQVYWNGGVQVVAWNSVGGVPLNEWLHVCVTYDANSVNNDARFFVNGVERSVLDFGTVPTGAFFGIATEICTIGNEANGTATFKGQLADVAVWNSILEPEEIKALYDASILPEVKGPGTEYNELPGFHKVHRNNLSRKKIAYTTEPRNTPGERFLSNTKYVAFQKQNAVAVKDNSLGMYSATGEVTSGTAYAARRARLFDGDYAQNVTSSVQYTWSAWIKTLSSPNGTPGATKHMFSFGYCSASYYSGKNPTMMLQLTNNGEFQFKLLTQTGTPVVDRQTWTSTSGLWSQDVWHHVVFQFSGSHGGLNAADNAGRGAQIWVDGTASGGTWDKVSKPFFATGSFTVDDYKGHSGKDVAAPISYFGGVATDSIDTGEFDGHVDEMSLFNTILSPASVLAIYNSGVPCDLTASADVPTASLMSWWRMGDDSRDNMSNSGSLTRGPEQGAPSAGNFITDVMNLDEEGGVNRDFALYAVAQSGRIQFAGSASAGALESCTPSTYDFEVVAGYNEENLFDNFYVQHAIPRSSKQYAWINASLESDNGWVGYTPPDYVVRKSYLGQTGEGFTEPYSFVSQSLHGSYLVTGTGSLAGKRLFGGTLDEINTATDHHLTDQWQPVDFAGLNTIIYEPISSSTNTLGYPRSVSIPVNGEDLTEANSFYINSFNINRMADNAYPRIGQPAVLNSILLNRNGPYGWPSWKPLRQSDHPLIRNQRATNTITVIDKEGNDDNFVTYNLPPVSNRGKPNIINFDTSTGQNITIKATGENEKIYFTSVKMDNVYAPKLDSFSTPSEHIIQIARSTGYDLNWVIYSQQLFPSIRNEFTTTATTKTGYDNNFWRDGRDARDTLDTIHNTTGVDGVLAGAKYRENSLGYYVSASAWPLDGPNDVLTRRSVPAVDSLAAYNQGKLTFSSASAGELQNEYMFWVTGQGVDDAISGSNGLGNKTQRLLDINNLIRYSTRARRIGAIYARPHMLDNQFSVKNPGSPPIPATGSFSGYNPSYLGFIAVQQSFSGSNLMSIVGGGQTFWSAGENAGYNIRNSDGTETFVSASSKPWFNNYEDFKHDLKLMAKGYSILPEYRISEKVGNYIAQDDQDNRFEGLELEIPGMPGADAKADGNFFISYSNSEFLKDFLNIKRESLLNATEIRLNVTGAIRFNPYKGFYPVQRTLDLVEQFKETYEQNIATNYIYFQDNDGSGRTMTGTPTTASAQPGIFPGIFDQSGTGSEGAEGGDTIRPPIVAATARPVVAPVFAPGILYNTIKSGIAVDYPIVSKGAKVQRYDMGTGSYDAVTGEDKGISKGGWTTGFINGYTGINNFEDRKKFFDERLPFETIINPYKHMAGKTFVDLEANPRAALSSSVTGTFIGAPLPDQRYNLMSRNFFGAVPSFFLKNSELTSLKSAPIVDGFTFKGDEIYMMRVKLARSTKGARVYSGEPDCMGAMQAFEFAHDVPSGRDRPVSAYGIFGAKYLSGALPSAIGPTGSQVQIEGTAIPNAEFPLPQDPVMTYMARLAGSTTDEGIFQETLTMYSRPSAFGPDLSGKNPDDDAENAAAAGVQAMSGNYWDSYTGINPAYTPPYYNGEAWTDIIFRPTAGKVYQIEDIIAESKLKAWRFDAGRKLMGDVAARALIAEFGGNPNRPGAPYSGNAINESSMQLTSSINVFGIEKINFEEQDKFDNLQSQRPGNTIAQRWVIRPKFETPILNFNNAKAKYTATNVLGRDLYKQAARGMWHQFGQIPKESEGIYVSIEDIPQNWLSYHYEVVNENSIYNNFTASAGESVAKKVKSLADLVGFQKNNTTKLGQLKEKTVLREAIVAIPYITERTSEAGLSAGPQAAASKKFISIPPERYEAAKTKAFGSAKGDSLDVAGPSISKQLQKMNRYVLPPQLDFINNPGGAPDPFVMYLFEFKYELDRDDLSYIWQNLAPRDYKKITFQHQSVAHALMDTEVLNEQILGENENLRWMIFKVKQKGQEDYWDYVDADAKNERILSRDNQGYQLKYNWPYDYISFVEMIKMNVELKFTKQQIKIQHSTDPNAKPVTMPRPATAKDFNAPSKADLALDTAPVAGNPLILETNLEPESLPSPSGPNVDGTQPTTATRGTMPGGVGASRGPSSGGSSGGGSSGGGSY